MDMSDEAGPGASTDDLLLSSRPSLLALDISSGSGVECVCIRGAGSHIEAGFWLPALWEAPSGWQRIVTESSTSTGRVQSSKSRVSQEQDE